MDSNLAYPLSPQPEVFPAEPVALPQAKPTSYWRGVANIASFSAVHLACLGAIWTGVSWRAVALCAASYLIRMFGITAGYHRYFSHKTYKMNRFMQFAMGWLACTSAQKGPLWWAAHHRLHHQNSDKPTDVHSPIQEGFWWSHVGWVMSTKYDETDLRLVPDLAKYPEMLWLNKYFLWPPVLWGAFCLWIGDWQGLVWGFFISTTILWHSTFTINSLAHLFGKKRFKTSDESRNNVWLALLTLGEGWHNNHHFYPSSTQQGFYWWEVDFSYYGLRFLEKLGLVSELRRPPARVLQLGREIDRKLKLNRAQP